MIKPISIFTGFFIVYFTTGIFTLTNNQQPSNDIINVDGKELTVRLGCTLCHNPTKKIVGPSFNEISKTYAGNQEKLLKFLNGQGNPIVHPKEFEYMKPVLNQLKHKTEDEKKALVAYIISLKQ